MYTRDIQLLFPLYFSFLFFLLFTGSTPGNFIIFLLCLFSLYIPKPKPLFHTQFIPHPIIIIDDDTSFALPITSIARIITINSISSLTIYYYHYHYHYHPCTCIFVFSIISVIIASTACFLCFFLSLPFFFFFLFQFAVGLF